VDDHFGPQTGVFFDKIQVERVGLIHGFIGGRIKNQQPRKGVRTLNHGAVGVGWNADVPLPNGVYGGEALKASPQLRAVGIARVGRHPKENMVYKHGVKMRHLANFDGRKRCKLRCPIPTTTINFVP
jgi:hypothetical protein